MKKINQLLNIIMGTFVGVFLGHALYEIWNFRTHPELYAMQSAPWYAGILVYGAFTVLLLAACGLVKMVLKYFAKKSRRKKSKE